MSPQSNLKVITAYNVVRTVVPTTTVDDEVMAASDLAVIKTTLMPRCHLELGDSRSLRVGEHLIAMGYPAYDLPAAALYEGFLSSRHPHAPIPVGSVGLQTVTTTHELLRVQMPLTPGTSGSPLIRDDDKVVGVVSEEPVIWTKELGDFLGIANRPNIDFGFKIQFPNGQAVDPTRLLAELAEIVHDFESPGAGLAVPTYYLKPPKDEDHQPSKPTD